MISRRKRAGTALRTTRDWLDRSNRRLSETVTFDVFDTVLIRRHASAEFNRSTVWRRLRSAGLFEQSCASWLVLREDAEVSARRDALAIDIELQTVYDRLAGWLGRDVLWVATCVEVELDVEIQSLVPNPLVGPLLVQSRRNVFVSDTCLPASAIREALQRCKIRVDRVVVSGEHGVSKRDGRLLLQALALERTADVKAHTHYGNDQKTDGDGAKRIGARWACVPDANFSRFEAVLASLSPASSPLPHLLAGAGRLTRLAHVHRKLPWLDAATGVAAPFVIASCIWVLLQAERRGIMDVYFVARDGELLRSVSGMLQTQVGIGSSTRLHYLYVSRRALASIDLTSVTHRREAAGLGYLRDQGLGTGNSKAFVDLGWRGQAATLLDKAVRAIAPPEVAITHLFAGGLVPSAAFMAPASSTAFLFDRRAGGAMANIGPAALLELFCAGREGTVDHYTYGISGVARPVLAAETNAAALNCGLELLQQVITEAASELAHQVEDLRIGLTLADTAACAPLIEHNLMSLWQTPSLSDAVGLGPFPWQDPHELASVALAQSIVKMPTKGAALMRKQYAGPWKSAALQLTLAAMHLPPLPLDRMRSAAQALRQMR